MAGSKDKEILKKIRSVIETVEVAEILTRPFNESIIHLLRVTSSSLGAEGASVLLPADEEGSLEFVWACGRVSDSLIGVTVPSGKGIAGFVFSTGQPMAVSDAERETSFYSEVDRNTGFSTHTVLATPLQFEGETTGVLEYVNRIGEPPFEPFSAEDMDLAALYADAVASMVHACRTADLLGAFSSRVLGEVSGSEADRAKSLLAELEGSPSHKELLELSLLVRELSSMGPRERGLCAELLRTMIRFGKDAGEGGFPESL